MSTFPLLDEERPAEEAAAESGPCRPLLRLCNNFHKYALFGYFTPLMRKAKEEGSASVRPDLLPDLWPSDDLVTWSSRFNSFAARSQQERGGSFQLMSTLYRTFWVQFIGIFLIKLVITFLSLFSIILMSRFLKWQEQSPGSYSIAERNKGLIAGSGILLLELLNIIGGAQCNFWAQRVGLRVQGVLVAGLFKRVITAPNIAMQPDLGSDAKPKASAYNLLMIDIPSIAEFIFALVDLIVLPIRITLSFQLLLYQVGASAMAGLLCLICVVVVILGLEIKCGYLKLPYLRHRDIRLLRAHEALSEIRSLRMIGWEAVAQESINDARKQEISFRKQRMYLDSLSASLSNAAYALTQIAIFVSYVIWSLQSDTNFVFKASVAIPVMQVVGRLVGPLTNLPFILNSLIEGYISVERYEDYVFGDRPAALEGAPSPVTAPHPPPPDKKVLIGKSTEIPEDENLVYAKNAIFNWVQIPKEQTLQERLTSEYMAIGESGSTIVAPLASGLPDSQQILPIVQQLHLLGDTVTALPFEDALAMESPTFRELARRFYLRVPSLQVKAGHCLAIIGPPGSGKSSLLLALLGEMKKFAGVVRLTRSQPQWTMEEREGMSPREIFPTVGYASQAPWLPGGTVRSLILLDRPFIEERYAKVVDACQLKPDFDSWQDGDERVIFEGAANLSGGQRCRVALARAVYGYPDEGGAHPGGTSVFLLDDPFGSVDPRVGVIIFKKLFGPDGLLKSAAVVLTIDEANLQCFLDSKELATEGLSVNLKLQIMDKGRLSDVEHYPTATGTREQQQLGITTILDQQRKKTGAETLLWEAAPEIVPKRLEADQHPMFTEQAYSGIVGAKTYWWYSRQVGYFVFLTMMMVVLTMHLTDVASDFWIAHWTAKFPETKGPTPTPNGAEPKGLKHLDKPSVTSSESHLANNKHEGSYADRPSTSFLETDAHTAPRTKGKKYAIPQGFLEPESNGDYEDSDILPRSLLEIGLFSELLVLPKKRTENDEVNLAALSIFVTLSLASTLAVIILYLLATFGVLTAAVSVHNKLLNCVMNAPFWLYDFLPIGVTINRFSADTEVIDGGPLFSMSYFFGSCVHVCITVVALCVLSPWCSPLVPLAGIAVYTAVYQLYRPTCREFQRSKLLALSPLCGNLSEAESGVIVIRALGAQDAYRQKNLYLTTNLLKTQFVQVGSNNWATTRLQLVAFPFTVINTVVPVFLKLLGMSAGAGLLEELFHQPQAASSPQMAGYIGLAISFALAFPTAIGSVVWSISLLEQKMCSVQRVKEIVTELGFAIDSEGKIQRPEGAPEEIVKTTMKEFPPRNGLQIRNVEVCYQKFRLASLGVFTSEVEEEEDRLARVNLPPTLIDITVEARRGEHIGVIGRTGSGKSTLLLALLNLVPVSKGSIIIDGIPATQISKTVLQQMIGVLPQLPVVRPGWTVRKLLDPQGLFPDHKALFSALQAVGLLKTINELPLGLDTVIVKDQFDPSSSEATAARQLSSSQLRLLSLARLALNANQYRLVLIDEPPPKQLATPIKPPVKEKEIVHRPIAGERGATSDINENEEGSVLNGLEEDEEEVEIGDLIRAVFPATTVIIAAHHASTLKACDSIWILSKGKLVAVCEAKSIVESQETLMGIIESHEQKQ